MLRVSKGRTYTIPVVAHTFDVLEFLFHSQTPLKLTEIAAHTGISRSTAYRILRTLELRGYISHSLDGRYSYGRSKPQKTSSYMRKQIQAVTPSTPQTAEALWVEHAIETLVRLLQESRSGNAVPLAPLDYAAES